MLTLSQLEQHLSKAAWILKGPVDAADFKVYIFPLLFFKRISDVYDEEYNEALSESDGDHEYASGAEIHRFIIPKGCHWNDVRPQPPTSAVPSKGHSRKSRKPIHNI